MSWNDDGAGEAGDIPRREPLEPLVSPHSASGNLSKRLKAPCFVFMCLGATILCLLLLMPIWNSSLMLRNPVFLHFIGTSIPAAIITVCVCLVVLYLIVISLFFRYSKKEAQSEQNMLMIGNVVITLLGASALIISMPMRSTGNAFQVQILEKCEHGPKTQELHQTYLDLSALRSTPSCVRMTSVESCPGFQRTKYTELLKAMEQNYRCSGWCSPPQPPRPAGLGLLQLARVARGNRESIRPDTSSARLLDLRSVNTDVAPTMHGGSEQMYVFPPTLFSTANFQATCDGMTARDVQYFLVDAADELYYEGVYLVFISIGIGFLKLIGFCMKDSIFSPKMPVDSYGATPQRYLSRGVLH